jgi:phage shock protein PspC (stress-responsive transcriptional regulator)
MALRAKRNKIFFGVVAGMAAEFLMMNFELRHCAAMLTPPVVPPEHLIV